MTRHTNVVRRGRTYYVRVSIPVDLRQSFGKAETWRSLHTKDRREAIQLAHTELAKLHAEWALTRQRLVNAISGLPLLSDADFSRIASRFYDEELARDQARRGRLATSDEKDRAEHKMQVARFAMPTHTKHDKLATLDASIDFLVMRDAGKYDAESRRGLIAELRRHSATGEPTLIRWAANEAIERDALPISEGSTDYRRLCQVLARAWIEALQRTFEYDEGKWSGGPKDPLLTPPIAANDPITAIGQRHGRQLTAVPGEAVMELFETYSRENPRNVKTDTLDQSRKVVALFAESLSRLRFPAAQIGKKEVRDWKALVQRLPIKAAEIVEFRQLTIREIVDRNEELHRPTIATRTVNKYLSMLSAFCDWLHQHGYLDSNPVNGLSISQDKDAQPISSYSIEELKKLFGSTLFTGCLSDSECHRPGDIRIDDHRKWFPLVALYSGARLGEIAQLSVSNVYEKHGHWIMHVTREGGKSTKTKGSQRVIPIHSILIDLGFLNYARRVKGTGATQLFPGIANDSRGQVAGGYSRAYGRYLSKIGVKTGRGLNFHSFRHTFVDALRRAEFADEAFGFLIGHTQGTTTGRYGNETSGSVRERVRLVEAVVYPGLDLSHLKLKPNHSPTEG
jgi:integrase